MNTKQLLVFEVPIDQ